MCATLVGWFSPTRRCAVAAKTLKNTVLTVMVTSVPVALRTVVQDARKAPGRSIGRAARVVDAVSGEVTFAPIKRLEAAVSNVRVEVTPGAGIAVANPEDGLDVVQGVWVSDSEFRPFPDGALDVIKDETRLVTIDVECFIPLGDVPWERVTGVYHLAPQAGMGRALKLIAEAMRKRRVAGLVKFSPGSSQQAGVLFEKHGAVLVCPMVYEASMKFDGEAREALVGVKVDAKMVAAAAALIDAMMAPDAAAAVAALHDDSVPLREALIEEAINGRVVSRRKRRAPVGDDVLASLEASLREAGVAS